MKSTFRKSLIAALLLTLVAGCGWQLRGSKNIVANIDGLKLSSQAPYGKLSRAIEEEMRIQHIASTGSHAWTLQILEEKMKQNIVAFSDTNNPATYEIELVVRFSVSNDKGEMVIAPNSERVVRPYEYNSNRRLAMDKETELLKDEVYQEMADNLLRRIDFIAGQKR